MHPSGSVIAGIALLVYLALAIKIAATVVIYRHKELPRGIRFVLLFRYATFFLCAPVTFVEIILPSRWHSEMIGLTALGTFVGVWLISVPVIQIFYWGGRRNQSQSEVAPAQVAKLLRKE